MGGISFLFYGLVNLEIPLLLPLTQDMIHHRVEKIIDIHTEIPYISTTKKALRSSKGLAENGEAKANTAVLSIHDPLI